MRALVLIGFTVLMLGCAARPVTVEDNSPVREGMTRMEVRKILGPPENFQKKGTVEAWQYCAKNRFNPVNEVTLVRFRDGRVSKVSVYQNVGLGACTQFFKSIDWEDDSNG